MSLRVLIVDDERLAREELRRLLAVHPDVVVAGEAPTVEAARRLMEAQDPDVLFVDIQLIGETGFALAGRGSREPALVFVTAHAEYAVRAFDVQAVDYLLKPVEASRLAETIDRLRTKPTISSAGANVPLDDEDRLLLRAGNRHILLPVHRVACITADGDYTQVTASDGSAWRTGKSLREWEARLSTRRFARIHRSAIVNLACVVRMEEWSHYSYRLHLIAGSAPLAVSRRCAAALRARLA